MKKPKPIKGTHVVIFIINIRVNKRTFSFNYQVTLNGNNIMNEKYNSSHTRSISTMKKYLDNGYAEQIVMGILSERDWVLS